jgi:hypothetical protein
MNLNRHSVPSRRTLEPLRPAPSRRRIFPSILILLLISVFLGGFPDRGNAATRMEIMETLASRLALPESVTGHLPADVLPGPIGTGHLRFAVSAGLIDPKIPFSPEAPATKGDALRLALGLMGWSFEADLVDRLCGTPQGKPPEILRHLIPPAPAGLLAAPDDPLETTDLPDLERWLTACDAGMSYEGRFGWEGIDVTIIRRGLGRAEGIWTLGSPGGTSPDASPRRFATSREAQAALSLDPSAGTPVRLASPKPQCLYMAVLRVDPARFPPRVRFATSFGMSRAPLSVIAASPDILAAVNGGFFSDQHPLGTLVLSGDPVGRPHPSRAALGVDRSGSVYFGHGAARSGLKVGEGFLELSHYGSVPDAQGITLYSPRRTGAARGTPPDALEAVLRDGHIVEFREGFQSDHRVPEEGLLVVARGRSRAALATLKTGDPLPLTTDFLTPVFSQCDLVLQAGPMLIENGQPVRRNEGFDDTLLNKRHPRTLVGIDGRSLVFAIVDGRNSFHSVGATMEEARGIAASLGCFAAMGLDGGGSTELWFYGGILNRPSDGKERPLPYGLVFSGNLAH